MSKKKKVERLALAMAQTLPGYMMPTPRFSEADDPFPDHEAAFGGRRADGSLLVTTKGESYGRAMVRHYLEERARSRQLYVKLAEEILDRVEVIKGRQASWRAEMSEPLKGWRRVTAWTLLAPLRLIALLDAGEWIALSPVLVVLALGACGHHA